VLADMYTRLSAILLDIRMPEMDGFEVLKQIQEKSEYRNIPIVIISVDADIATKERAIELGAHAFLSKPFNPILAERILKNLVSMRENAALVNSLSKDKLTGLMSRDLFFDECDKRIAMHEPGYYILSCMDIDNFKVINDQYGMEVGDEVLKHIAKCVNTCVSELDGLACRFTADRFAILYPAEFADSDIVMSNHKLATTPKWINRSLRIRIGRYLVNDSMIRSNIMFERATVAEESLKGRYDIYIAEYTDSMRFSILHEQQIVSDMEQALRNGEFKAFFQPQYNHATKAMIGAEALVRWEKDGTFISPGEFIPIFERNGFIYEVDKFIWEQVCIYLKKWIDEGMTVLPVSVNISRFDLYKSDFFDVICGLIKKYQIPSDCLRLEVTESAFAESPKHILKMVNQLIDYGFTVEIDDFGSGYSSLNTLKDVPASILKLDMKFFSNTENAQRSGNIIESVVRMAKWLGMAVIAEGVEELNHADFLKSIGCYYIQGYLYAKPMPLEEYEELLQNQGCSEQVERKLSRLQAIATLDNIEFWNPKSMEMLIFNSYVGGACIFEYYHGVIELLRVNEQYVHELGTVVASRTELRHISLECFLDDENNQTYHRAMMKAIQNKREAGCELTLRDLHSEKEMIEYIRCTMRVIAISSDRYLFYCVLVNRTKEEEAFEQLQFLNATAHDILEKNDVKLAMEASLDKMCKYFVADRAYLVELDFQKKVSNRTYEVCAKGITTEQSEHQEFPFDESSFWYDSLTNGKIICLEEIGQMDEEYSELIEIFLKRDIHAIIMSPIIRSTELLGFVGIDNPTKSLGHLERLMAVGDYLGIMLDMKVRRADAITDEDE
ncbi:MAG: EAL domain-containing protein, partial [Clostridia bacterium]|nr:EAL domain-containing protein [Clostridia bacterium]